MAAIRRVADTTDGDLGEWLFHYYGKDTKHVREEALRFNVSKKIRLHGQVTRTEVLSAVREHRLRWWWHPYLTKHRWQTQG